MVNEKMNEYYESIKDIVSNELKNSQPISKEKKKRSEVSSSVKSLPGINKKSYSMKTLSSRATSRAEPIIWKS
jgi:hypothetical protein